MNRFPFFACLLLIGLWACSSNSNTSATEDKEIPVVDSVAVYRAQAIRDSLQHRIDSLEASLEPLKENFEYKAEDFEGRSWYHKAWKYKYNYLDHTLISGVDSTGHFFLLSNLRGGADNLFQKELHIKMEDTVYIAQADTNLGHFRSHDLLLCACTWEIAVHSGEDALRIGKMISENPQKPMRMVFVGEYKRSFSVVKRVRNGIRDCYLLSEGIREIRSLEGELGD